MRPRSAIIGLLVSVVAVHGLGDGPGPSDVPYVEAVIGKRTPEPALWSAFLRDNLEPDLAVWRTRAPLRTAAVLEQFDAYKELLLVYNNTLYWLDRPDPNGPEPDQRWASMMTAALQSGRVQLPNCLLIYITDDNIFRFGDPRRNQTAPHFALMKSIGHPGAEDLDILLPQMRDVSDSLHMVPWHLKKDLAFFRGVPTCTGKWVERYGYLDTCPRAVLSYYTDRDNKAGNGTVLDVAITEPYQYRSKANSSIAYEPPVKTGVPIPQWSRYKWLLNLEGLVAAYRLSQPLMTVNSLVLFQRVPYMEYFYRSIHPWQHYVPFWNATGPDGAPRGMDDVYDVIRELRRLDAEEPAKIQQIIANAQTFVTRFLTNHMRIAYYRAALEQYKALFPDMDQFIADYLPQLRAKGWKI
eukprot:XP_001696717.1 predicted protein [Chlamydomonas reinhardtii]